VRAERKIGEKEQLLLAMLDLTNPQFTQNRAAHGFETGHRCLELARDRDDPELCSSAHWAIACCAHSCGNLEEAVTRYEEAIRFAEHTSAE
jgi:hypothetical protein